MDPLPEHEFICALDADEKKDQVLDRLRRNDPTLKELTLVDNRTQPNVQMILQTFDAIATNSSLKVLELDASFFLGHYRTRTIDRITRALVTNTSVKHLRLGFRFCQRMPGWATEVFDIVRASPNLEALTLRDGFRLSGIENIAALAQGLCAHTNLHSLTIEAFFMHSNCAAAFAAAFQANQTIKTLIMGWWSIGQDAGVSFVEALPRDHSLETIIFDKTLLNDDSVVSIIRTLCHKNIKVLSLLGFSNIGQEGCTRIVQILKENEHNFTKLALFMDSQVSPWQNNMRLEIDRLTWENHFQVEKDTWLDQFLGQDTPTKELLFLALERAKKADNERFSKASDILFHLIKQVPHLIVQAICDGHKMSGVMMSPPLLAARKVDEEGLLAQQNPTVGMKRRRDED